MRPINILFSTATPALAMLNCQIHVDGLDYDLSPLGKSIYKASKSFKTSPTTEIFTSWYIDPCGAIESVKKAPDDAYLCPSGTQICGVQRVRVDSKEEYVTQIIPVSGDLDGKQSSATIVHLKPDVDDGKEGLKVHLKGGNWGDYGNIDAMVEFICSKDREEGVIFEDWNLHTLKLQFNTKLVCRDAKNGPSNGDSPPPHKDNGGSWGLFTWLIVLFIIGFLGYLVFSVWVNYNRYGQIGLDSTPFGDLINEIPFVLRDLANKVSGLFSGSSSNRGDYTSVS